MLQPASEALTSDEWQIETYRNLCGYIESQLSVMNGNDDPIGQLVSQDDELWQLINEDGRLNEGMPYHSTEDLARMRRLCRMFYWQHPFAECAHENRISYVIGEGHTYSVGQKPGRDVPEEALQDVQDEIDEFVKRNKWQHDQQENLMRRDRDGEVFIRSFVDGDGGIVVRHIEPGAVATPDRHKTKPEYSFGIQTEPDDHQSVLAYWVNGEPIDAAEVQHRKRGLDSACKRGIPILWSVRKNLVRTSKILRNGSAVTELQTAIGMIRKFEQATRATVTTWANNQANIKQTSNAPGYGANGTNSRLSQEFPPGTILNASGNIGYEFPAMGVDPGKYVASLQAELRAVAARLVMPEFMLSAKSDDQNRAAAFAAEGPSVRMFKRLQWDEICFDLELIERQLALAVEAGRLSMETVENVNVTAEPPTVAVRNHLEESQVRAADMLAGILSPQTAAAQARLDYRQEMANIEAHDEAQGGLPGNPVAPPLPPAPDEGEGDDES